MSEIEKICVHFKETKKVGNSGQELFYCDARDFVLGEDAKICFVCDEYKPGKNEYDEQIKQSIVDFLSGKRKREGKRWTKKKGSGKKSGSRKSRDEYDEDEEEEEPEGEEEEAEGEETEEEEAEGEEEEEEEEEGAKGAKKKKSEEGDEEEEEEEGEVEEEEEEGEDGEKKKSAKAAPAKKPAAKKSGTKKPASKEPTKSAKPAKEVALDKEDTELLDLIKSKGDAGIIQMNLKDESKLPSSKISKIVLKLKDAGLIVKEKTKVKDDKGKTTITNLIKASKSS
jgi:hypothetical protein